MLLHASTVAINGKAAMLAGAPGIGKSDLALRLIDAGALLIADDQTLLRCDGEKLLASPPDSIAGLIEVRHVGLMRLPFTTLLPVALYVELVSSTENLERLPELGFMVLEGVNIRRVFLPAFAASTPAKIRTILKYEVTHQV